MIEIWKDVVGYPTVMASNFGRVRSKRRVIVKSNGNIYTAQERILAPKKVDKKGYYRVCIQGGSVLLHRLIALAFHERPSIIYQVNHVDGIKTNNKAINLEWVTAKGNAVHARDNGLQKPPKGANHWQSKKVVDISNGQTYDTIREAANGIGMCEEVLRRRLLGRQRNETNLVLA